MTTDMFSRTGSMDTSTKARAAVAEFRRMLPTLSSYARALTGKDSVQVVMSGSDNGSTDGHKIYFRPPIELGEQHEHDRLLCDKRGENLQQLCNACRVREDILVVIYHEMAHIAFGSFRQPTAAEIERAVEIGFAGHTDDWSIAKSEAIAAAPYYAKKSWMQLAAVVSSYLPMLVNCLEDARVNRAMFEARPGIKTMLEAMVQKIFTEGFEASDGRGGVQTIRWNEQPLNAQVMIGVFCKVSGYDYTGWFKPQVEEALNDPGLTLALRGMSTVRSAANVYTLSIITLIKLRELGFLLEPHEMTQPEPEPEEDEDSESGSDEEPDEDESEESDESGEPGDGESSEEDSGDGASDTEDSGDSSGESGTSEDDSVDGDHSTSTGDNADDGSADRPLGEDASVEHSSGEGGDESADAGSAGSEQPDGDELPDGEGSESGDMEGPSGGSDRTGGTAPVTPGDDPDSERSESEAEASAPLDEGEDGSDDDGPGAGLEPDEDHYDPKAVRVIDNEANDDKPESEDYGTPEDVETALLKFGDHDEPPTHVREGDSEDAVEVAIIQGIYFETDSRYIRGVRFLRHGESSGGRRNAWNARDNHDARTADLSTPESIIGRALLKSRRVFEDNARAKYDRNRKNGRVNARSLGRRAPFDDERLFKKRYLPGKKDYCVIIGVDVSGSTHGTNIVLEKQAVSAQCELLSRLGVEFAVYAHSGDFHEASRGRANGLDLDIYPVKELHEPWDTKTKQRLQDLGSSSCNLDGHALEFLRKRADESRATDKIILYYSDGQMPAENRDEELVILQREIRTCRSKGYTLLGVGIRTDSPKQHGLDTVEVNSNADLSKVIDHLEKRLLAP